MGSLRFILGRAGSGKTTHVVSEISELLHAEPLGDPILLLVPDQATLLYERLLACGPTSGGGYLRATVITYRHLIERILCEAGGNSIAEVTPLGRRILIGRLLRRMQPQLAFYRSTARQPGLAARLDDAFAEIERSGRNLDDLLFIAGDLEAQSPGSPLPAKLRDLHLLLGEYERILGGERLDQHRRFALALKAIATSASVAATRLYVDDFYELSATERALILQFARYGMQTTVALPIDPNRAGQASNEPTDGILLRGSTNTYLRLRRAAQEANIALEQVLLRSSPRFQSQGMLHVDRQFDAPRPGKLDAVPEVRFVESTTRRDEVDAAARQIQAWVKQGLRLRDVLVLARDISGYERDIESSFRDHGIAFFIDRQRPASHHPLVRAVRAVLQLTLSDYRHDVVIDLMKSGLCGIAEGDCDAVENYLLAHRIRGTAAWTMPWTFRRRRRSDDELDEASRERLDSINATRARIVASVETLAESETARPAGEWCTRLCTAIESLGIRDELARLISARQQEGALELAASDSAVWTEFAELLEQLCSVLAEEQLTLREYAEVLDVALERFTLAITPPTIDQVLVGSVDRTRSSGIVGCIVLGLSEGIFPARSDDVFALSDEDREQLELRQFELRADTRRALIDEQTFAYLAFTRTGRYLTLMRHCLASDGRSIGPSIFWTQLTRLFRDPIVERPAADDVSHIATPGQLAARVVDWADTIPGEPSDALALTRWLLDAGEPHVTRARDALVAAMEYDNASRLSPELASRLMPGPVRMSATRLESYAACPFKHFAQHTLRLRPREETELTRLDLGSVYHHVLEDLVGHAIRSRAEFTKPIPRVKELIREFTDVAAAELRSEFLLTPGRHRYLLEGVRDTLEHVVETQRHAIASGAFRPTHTEFAFGDDGRHPPLELITPEGRTVHLRGRIDRLDAWPMADAIAATVIDYKLSEQRIDFARIHRGLSLQLLTYLLAIDALGETLVGKPVQPAAAFYVRLLRQIESLQHPCEKPDPQEPTTFLKRYKPRGIVDERFVGSLDAEQRLSLSPCGDPAKLRKGDVLSPEAFERLIDWTRTKIGELVDRLLGGSTEVRPYRLKTITPCPTCDFRSVCRLDLAFNRYLPITESAAEALEKIVGGDE